MSDIGSIHCAHSAPMARRCMATIFMPLLDEGTYVLRPVEATRLSADVYRVDGEVPDGEEWAFAPGTAVRCEQKAFERGEAGLVAVGVERG